MNLMRLLIFFVCLLLMNTIYAEKHIHCPKEFTFKCIPDSESQYTICTITSHVDLAWNFAAPDRVITQETMSIPQHGSGQSSQSILPKGDYQAVYGFSYYGPVTGAPGLYAYCLYGMKNYPALAGLYTNNYKNTGKNWQSGNGKFICQSAPQCKFVEINN